MSLIQEKRPDPKENPKPIECKIKPPNQPLKMKEMLSKLVAA